MKITKTRLKDIIKEELQGLAQEGEDLPRSQPGLDELTRTMEDISNTYRRLSTNQAREIYENYLQQNVELYIKTWREERASEEIDPIEPVTEDKQENNPWAICTDSVGREDKDKYESCVKSVKKQNREK